MQYIEKLNPISFNHFLPTPQTSTVPPASSKLNPKITPMPTKKTESEIFGLTLNQYAPAIPNPSKRPTFPEKEFLAIESDVQRRP